MVKAALQGPFDEAIERVEESTGVVVPKRSAEEMVKEAATDFDAFYAQRVPAAPEAMGPIVAGAVDGKGCRWARYSRGSLPLSFKATRVTMGRVYHIAEGT